MKMSRTIRALLLAGTIAPASARADHHGMAMSHGEDPSAFGASVALLAASFDTMYYVGDYQGVLPSASWSSGWFVGGASLPYYRIRENGLETYGPGDLVINGQARLLDRQLCTPFGSAARPGEAGACDRGALQGGVMMAVSFPTGNSLAGLGMGHDMPLMMDGLMTSGAIASPGFAGARSTPAGSAQRIEGEVRDARRRCERDRVELRRIGGLAVVRAPEHERDGKRLLHADLSITRVISSGASRRTGGPQ